MDPIDVLNGYWEEGYHYYLEFRDGRLTVRGYRRNVLLETAATYDAAAAARGERTVIRLADNVLSRGADGQRMMEIRELSLEENGELRLLEYYTVMGEKTYTLRKTDRGPFDHIRIRDGEFLPRLQGTWKKWPDGEGVFSVLTVSGNRLSAFGLESLPFHAVSFTYAPDKVFLVPEDLTKDDFGAFTRVEVLPEMLTATLMVCDMSMPLSVFARAADLGRITPPAAALRPAVNTMTANRTDAVFSGLIGMRAPTPPRAAGPKFCRECGAKFNGAPPKFCPDCGEKVKTE